MDSYLVVITTTDNETVAEKLANTVLNEKLAACVQLIPKIKSFYWWKGKIESSTEILIFIKTKKELYEKLESLMKENHNYTVPEIIALPVKSGIKEYLNWIDEVTA